MVPSSHLDTDNVLGFSDDDDLLSYCDWYLVYTWDNGIVEAYWGGDKANIFRDRRGRAYKKYECSGWINKRDINIEFA